MPRLLAAAVFLLLCRLRALSAHRLCVDVDPGPFIKKALGFDANADFRCPSLELMSPEEVGSLDYARFLDAIKEDSEGKLSIMALGDKLTLSGAVEGARLAEQLPVLLWARLIDGERVPNSLPEDVARFVRAQEEKGERGFSFVLKPAHTSNGGGVLVMSRDKWKAEGWNADMLIEYIDAVLDTVADDSESKALQSLVPGILVQPRYPAPPLGTAGHYEVTKEEVMGQTAEHWVKHLRTAVWDAELRHWKASFPDHELIMANKITCDMDDGDEEDIPADEHMRDRLQQIADDDGAGSGDGSDADDLGFAFAGGTDCIARVQKVVERGYRPIEVRVLTVWGSAYIGVMWHGYGSPDNFFVTREADGSWKAKVYPFSAKLRDTLREGAGGADALGGGPPEMISSRHQQELIQILQDHMPDAVARAEKVAQAFKAPWLRVDFFMPATPQDAESWGLVLNEVAYGSGVMLYDRDSKDEVQLAEASGAAAFMTDDLPEVMRHESAKVAKAVAEGWKRRPPGAPTSGGRATLEALGCRFLGASGVDDDDDGAKAYERLRCWRAGDPSARPRDY